jgi:hypothetical protein
MTLKFSGVAPSDSLILLGQLGVATGIPPTTDTRLITISNTGSGNIDVAGFDNTATSHLLATVGANQTVALLVPTLWFTTGLIVTNFGTAAGQGVVTIN